MNKQKLLKTYSMFFLQLIILLVAALLFLVLRDWLSFKSVLLGGFAWLIPNFYFIKRLKKIKKIFSAQQMLIKFLLNEMLKLLSSFSLIVLVLLTSVIAPLAFLGGYILMVVISFLIYPGLGKSNV